MRYSPACLFGILLFPNCAYAQYSLLPPGNAYKLDAINLEANTLSSFINSAPATRTKLTSDLTAAKSKVDYDLGSISYLSGELQTSHAELRSAGYVPLPSSLRVVSTPVGYGQSVAANDYATTQNLQKGLEQNQAQFSTDRLALTAATNNLQTFDDNLSLAEKSYSVCFGGLMSQFAAFMGPDLVVDSSFEYLTAPVLFNGGPSGQIQYAIYTPKAASGVAWHYFRALYDGTAKVKVQPISPSGNNE